MRFREVAFVRVGHTVNAAIPSSLFKDVPDGSYTLALRTKVPRTNQGQ